MLIDGDDYRMLEKTKLLFFCALVLRLLKLKKQTTVMAFSVSSGKRKMKLVKRKN
jgi:hypothetical protein